MLAEAAGARPKEACGLLFGTRGQGVEGQERITAIRPAANVAEDPTRHFEIDPATLIAALREERAGAGRAGLALLGWYHSHPVGEAIPSAQDRACASGDGRIWAIIAQGQVRLWRDCAHGFEMLPTCLAPG